MPPAPIASPPNPMTASASPLPPIAFIGGGNMASALLGGLLQRGLPAGQLAVVEPFEPARAALREKFGITAQPAAGDALARAAMVVWAVKPQPFTEAAAATRAHTATALHLSVAAGIPTDSIARWLHTQHIVRAMPNTPALVGKGMTGLFARTAVTAPERALVDAVVATTGEHVWLTQENHLDAVTALSGSGPAYVFYFLEAMVQAGVGMGLTEPQARQLAVGTFSGGAALAGASSDPLQLLRERVTSKGGTTYAALTSLEASGVKDAFVRAMQAAQQRAEELGDEFGKA